MKLTGVQKVILIVSFLLALFTVAAVIKATVGGCSKYRINLAAGGQRPDDDVWACYVDEENSCALVCVDFKDVIRRMKGDKEGSI